MYQITCDGYHLLDLRDDSLMLVNPRVKLETNTVGEASFTIHKKHPNYDKLHKLKSVFEISDEIGVIFRGRMTDDSIDFNNAKVVDLEGSMAFFNDSVVRPFVFPDDFLEDADYITASTSGNVIEFFLNWLINNHNSQVQTFQQFKLGTVTVTDPNNYLARSSEDYCSTWETLKNKLFDSALGGDLCIRYEADGNYIDYLSDFTVTNTQDIVFGENLLDISHESDASETYSAVIPLGKDKMTIESYPDGDITGDIVKSGDTLYSKSAVESYGWIYAPIKETTWDDVTVVSNLVSRGEEYLTQTAVLLADTVEITAVDLHYSDAAIRSFRIYRNVRVTSEPHNISKVYRLTKLNIDILKPQNTKITVGESRLTLTDLNADQKAETDVKIESTKNELKDYVSGVEVDIGGEMDEIRETITERYTAAINTSESIILSALEKYVETSNYEEFRQTLETQLSIMSDEILMNFTTTTEQITNVDGDLQSKFTELYKYISFANGNITLGSSENAITLTIENDLIVFRKNGAEFGSWDGNYFYTGNIFVRVNESARFGNFEFRPRTDGSLMLLKVGG